MAKWTPADIPSLDGKVAVVTGATSGIGETAAARLAGRGARVVLAVRDEAKGETTRGAIRASHPAAEVEVIRLDLAELASVRAFAAVARETLPKIDILLANAGLGMQPRRAVTVDGFERQFGTNHLGHFALTGLLLPLLLAAPAPRVVLISSLAHRGGTIDFADLQGETRYRGGKAYAQSKLANLLFALELDRRAEAAGSTLCSVAAHPGVSSTGFVEAIGLPRPIAGIAQFGSRLLGQSAERGAWPGLYAATMPRVHAGQYWGPDGFGEIAGRPTLAAVGSAARDREAAGRLWRVSEDLTGVDFRALDEPAARPS